MKYNLPKHILRHSSNRTDYKVSCICKWEAYIQIQIQNGWMVVDLGDFEFLHLHNSNNWESGSDRLEPSWRKQNFIIHLTINHEISFVELNQG